MASSLRCVLVLLVSFGFLPAKVSAQGTSANSLLQALSGGMNQGQGGSLSGAACGAGILSPSTGAVSPSIRNLRQRQIPLERLELQDFVVQSTGRDLPIFGSELFKFVPSTYAPVEDISVTADYVIGPGDEVLIVAWGQLDVGYTATVDRNGTISIPKIRTINVAGVKYQELPPHLKTAIGRVYRNFDLTVSLGQLRSIQVFVVDQAHRPGSYTVSSVSTLINAVFTAGGPSVKGSMRGIQLKRGNKVVTELDLYDLLVNGDKSKDASLVPGDVVYIPPVDAMVAISGSVNASAIFEIKKGGTLGDLLIWAVGLASTASGQKSTVERINNHEARKVDEFKLDATGTKVKLQDGDLVTIQSFTLCSIAAKWHEIFPDSDFLAVSVQNVLFDNMG